MKTRILILIMISLAFLACSKTETYSISNENGIELIQNNGIPNKDKMKVELKEMLAIPGFREDLDSNGDEFFIIKDLQVLPDGSILLYDGGSSQVYKYSAEGEMEMIFSGKGNGPGEVAYPNHDIFIFGNRFALMENLTLHFFDFNCHFLNRRNLEIQSYTYQAFTLNPEEYILVETKFAQRSDGGYLQDEISKYNADFEKLKTIDDEVLLKIDDLGKDTKNSYINEFSTAIGNEIIYVAKRSKGIYEIDCYDFSLNKIRTITKDFVQINYSSEELDFIENNFVGNIVYEDFWKEIFDKKLSFNALHYDESHDYLIVEKSPELARQTISFDVFQNGIYLNNFDLPIEFDDYHPMPEDFNILIRDGKLYYYSESLNKVSVFEISYQI